MVLAVSGAVAAVALTMASAHARVDPVVPLDPFEPSPDSCIVPAADQAPDPCAPFGAPDRLGAEACNLPVVYLGGRPGPCPEPQTPPESRIIPIGPAELSR